MQLEIRQIAKSFRKKQVLKDISLTAEPGTCIGILGANGCGKSTLLSMLAGVQSADGGSFLWDGRDLLRDGKTRAAQVGYVPQGTPLIEELNARDNLLLWYDRTSMKEQLRDGVLHLLGIEAFLNVPVSKMSGGYASNIIEEQGDYKQDIAKAKEYLAQSSYNGEPIKYLFHASGNFYKASMAVIPALESIGLKVEAMIVDNGSHTAMRKDPATGHDIGCWEVQKNEENPVLHSTFVTGSQGWWSSPAKDAAIAIMKTTPTGSKASVDAYNDYLQAVIDECPYVLFGHVVGYLWTSPDYVSDMAGQTNYYWNNYFVK